MSSQVIELDSNSNSKNNSVDLLNKKYLLLNKRPIGRGAFGSIFLVRSLNDNLKYVLKTSNSQHIYTEEIKILQQINSPYVIKYEDSFQKELINYIVMEYCEYGDLRNQIKAKIRQNSKFESGTVGFWSGQMVNGMHYLHSNAIIHRDIKPGNIFLTKNGHIKLGDLGSASQIEDTISILSTYAGTPSYMSPEMRRNKKYSYNTDCWSTGCTIYELVTLKQFFNMIATVEQGAEYSFDHLETSDLVKYLLQNMLQYYPNNRANSMQLLSFFNENNDFTEEKNKDLAFDLFLVEYNENTILNESNDSQSNKKKTQFVLQTQSQNIGFKRKSINFLANYKIILAIILILSILIIATVVIFLKPLVKAEKTQSIQNIGTLQSLDIQTESFYNQSSSSTPYVSTTEVNLIEYAAQDYEEAPFIDPGFISTNKTILSMTPLDDTRLATSSNENEILVWNIKNGRYLFKFRINQTAVSLLATDNETLLTGCVDGYIREWNLRKGRLIREFYSEPGTFKNEYLKSDYMYVIKLVMNSNGYLISGHQGAYVSVWNYLTGDLLRRLDEIPNLIFLDSLFFLNNGNLVSSFTSKYRNITIRVENITIRDSLEASNTTVEFFNIELRLFKIFQILVAQLSKTFLLVNVDSSSILIKLNLITKKQVHFYSKGKVSVFFQMLNGYLVMATNTTLILLADEAETRYGELNGHSKPIRLVSQALDGTLISYAEDNAIRLWNKTLLEYNADIN